MKRTDRKIGTISRWSRLHPIAFAAMLAVGTVAVACASARPHTTDMGRCLKHAERILAGFQSARAQLVLAARHGNPESQLCLASLDAGLRRYKRAFHWYARAAQAGNSVAKFDLGVMYDRGLGVKRSPLLAAHWYRWAARQGNPYAQYNLASLYEHKLGGRSMASAAHWYRIAARRGLPLAELRLGVLYHAGVGVKRNNAVAAYWLRDAAEHGLAPAQYDLAEMLDSGQGVPANKARAIHWYRAAASQGNVNAQNSLGLIYQTGRGVARSPHKAAHWFRLAAEKGDPSAQYNLGVMYAYGGGIRRNLTEGDMWLTLAQASSLGRLHLAHGPNSIERHIEPIMTLSQIATAQEQAGQWLAGQRLLRSPLSTPTPRRPRPNLLRG